MANTKNVKKERTPKQLANDQRLRDIAAARRGSRAADSRADSGTTHQTRDTEQRALEEHLLEDAPWAQPESLAAPPPRPGMVQRWVRTSVLGKDDAVNIARKYREGWRPRDPSTVKNVKARYPTLQHGQFGSVIAVEGMVLCEMSAARVAQKRAFINGETAKRTAAIDAQLGAQSKTARLGGYGAITKQARSVAVRERKTADLPVGDD